MNKSAANNFKNGLYCAESVVLSITEAHGIESDLLPKMATAFCSGMSRTCGICGALTGAVMGISAVLGRSSADESVEKAYKATGLIVEKFESEFGARNCHELLGCDLGTPEGQSIFRENKLHENCRRYTTTAAEFAERILRSIHINPISEVDEVYSLLKECGLPTNDLEENQNIKFYGIKEESGLVGLVGLEVLEDVGLLRSVAVHLAHRRKGLGELLVEYAESEAVSEGISTLYLLTTTASSYFKRLGYSSIGRELAPDKIKQTSQFSTICPSSADFMAKEICS